MSTRRPPVALIDGQGYALRHVFPGTGDGATTTILGRAYGYRWLPSSGLPDSPDLVEGSYTRRLGDAGEFSLTFPNGAASDGRLWRERFSVALAREFVEVYRGGRHGDLEFVGSIERIEADRGTVTVSGASGWALLRRAYEGDRSWTAAPRDVIETYTRVPVAELAQDFDAADTAWEVRHEAGDTGSTAYRASRIIVTSTEAGGGASARATIRPVTLAAHGSSDFRALAIIPVVRFTPVTLTSTGATADAGVSLAVTDVDGVALAAVGVRETFVPASGARDRFAGVIEDSFQPTADLAMDWRGEPLTLVLERRGRWLAGWVNGVLLRMEEIPAATAYRSAVIEAYVNCPGSSNTTSVRVEVDGVLLETQRPFLARGSDKGDRSLPGDYPTGGLRGRYWSDSDLQGLAAADRRARVLAPNREPYAERLDPTLSTATGLSIPPQPGSAGTFFSARWFGAVYLRLDLGDYVVEVNEREGARVWIGRTDWGDQLIDHWIDSPGQWTSATLTAASLGGRAGWYPIVVEHHHAATAYGFQLAFTAPAAYTDPGGTAITSVRTDIPSTSLSPLGCFDQRVQAQPYFELVQRVAADFGYQVTDEPRSLESGEFPARLVPRIRVGRDTDVRLRVEDDDRHEPLFSPGLTIDGSEQAVIVRGSGAGLPDARGSQVTAEVADMASAASALFAMEARVDAGEISFPDLLAARLGAELALRTPAWEEVRGTPRAQDRLADTWPLTGTLSAMRWNPGDGVMIEVPDIGVEDTAPRQLLQVTRSFAALGRTGCQVGFRQRPRSAAASMLRLLRASLAPQRTYQGQVVTLPGHYVSASGIAAGAFTGYSVVPLLPGDRVVRAYVRIVQNATPVALGIEINGMIRTATLGGAWSLVPTEIDVTAHATQVSATDNRMHARLRNDAAGASGLIEFQALVEVLR